MNVTELMTSDPVCLLLSDTIAQAASVFEVSLYRHLPVVNDAGELVGMLSDRDVRTSSEAPVSTVMSSNVVCLELEDDVARATALLLEHKIGALPVVDQDDKLVGIVSYRDLLRHYSAFCADLEQKTRLS